MSTTRDMLTLFSYKFPEAEIITVYNKGVKTEMSVETYNETFKTQMTRGLVCDKKHEPIVAKILEQICLVPPECKEDMDALNEFIAHPIQYSNLTYTNEICNYGQMANRNISTNTIIGLYSGELIIKKCGDPCAPRSERIYDMSFDLGKSNGKKKYYVKIKNAENIKVSYYVSIRASNYGEETRFALHAPNSSDISKLKNQNFFHTNINEEKILTSNVTYCQAIYQKTPVLYFKTQRDIKENELLVIDYGLGYWGAQPVPKTNMIVEGKKQDVGMPNLFLRDNPNFQNILTPLEFNVSLNMYVKAENKIILPFTKASNEMAIDSTVSIANQNIFTKPPVIKRKCEEIENRNVNKDSEDEQLRAKIAK